MPGLRVKDVMATSFLRVDAGMLLKALQKKVEEEVPVGHFLY